jgi:hypothetical protein
VTSLEETNITWNINTNIARVIYKIAFLTFIIYTIFVYFTKLYNLMRLFYFEGYLIVL